MTLTSIGTDQLVSVLGEAAQTLWLAVRGNEIGKVRLVYAEIDDDFVPRAPYPKWLSESGAPWPFRDKFTVGCTLEHAGYYLTWLMAMFGTVEGVIAASANLVPDKLGNGVKTAPDCSRATLFFKSGLVARLTCSIVAPHNHSIRIIGDAGILEVAEGWNNNAAVRVRRRFAIRRKLINSPFTRRLRIDGATHPKVKSWGAAALNFALGPADAYGVERVAAEPSIGRVCSTPERGNAGNSKRERDASDANEMSRHGAHALGNEAIGAETLGNGDGGR